MNRTNSVEPVFSQPLQGVSYHQLLQNKTKIEDELYQTQRQVILPYQLKQLRRKEGEYLKKIAVYEQKIDQLEEQLDEFRLREEQTKSMYEKILSALNTQDKSVIIHYINEFQTYQIDLERVQEMIQSMAKGTIHHQNGQPSPTNSERSLNSSFRRGSRINNSRMNQAQQVIDQQREQQYQMQIESLEQNVQSLNESLSKSKQQLNLKERENQALEKQISQLKSQIEHINIETQAIKDQSQTQKIQLSTKIEELEIQLSQQQQKNSKDGVITQKEKESLNQTLKEAENQIVKLKKQMSKELCNYNENNKRMRQKISDLEKELQQLHKANEDQLKNSKNAQMAKGPGMFIERKNSNGNINQHTNQRQSNNNLQQQNTAEIHSKKNLNNTRTTQQRSSGGAQVSMNNKKINSSKNGMHHQLPQPICININNESEVVIQPQQNYTPMIDLSSQQSFDNQSRMRQDSQKDQQNNDRSNQDDTSLIIESQNKKQISQNSNKMFQRRNFFEDSVFKSNGNMNNGQLSTKNNNQLHKYINISTAKQDPLQDSDICNNGGTTILTCGGSRSVSQQPTGSRSASNHQLSSKKRLSQERSPQQKQRTLLTHIPSNRYLNDGDKALLSSIEIEQVVRRMLDQVYLQPQQNQEMTPTAQPLMPSQYHNIQQTPSQNVSFSMKKIDNNYYSNSSKHSHQQQQLQMQQQFTFDKDFLTKLENSLKKLAKQNEKIKMIMREKDAFEKQVQKLKLKIRQLKDDKSNLLIERETLVQQNHKMECRLKQAQVILNLDGGEAAVNQTNNGYGNNNTTIYEMSRGSSQKTLVKHFQGNRDVSPGQQSNLTLNIIHDTSGDRYKNPPMSCRVNDSYDISLRLLNHDSSAVGTSTKKPIFNNTLDKSLLDQSLLTIKRDMLLMQQQQQLNMNQQIIHPRQLSNQQFSKFLPHAQQFSSHQQQNQNHQFRGKTPTLQINLSQSPIQQEAQPVLIEQRGSNNPAPIAINMHTQSNDRGEENESALTSRNFSRSTTNLLNKKAFQHQYQNPTTVTSSQQTQRQLFKYQSNRDQTNIRQGSLMNKLFSTQNNQQLPSNHYENNTNTSISKGQHNYSSVFDQNSNPTFRDKSPQPFTQSAVIVNNQSQASSVNILRRMNSTKAKDRYYNTNKRNSNGDLSIEESQIRKGLQKIQSRQQKYQIVENQQQIITFDEEEDYFSDQQQDNQQQIYSNKAQYEEYSENEDQDTDENNAVQLTQNSESSLNIKLVPLPRNDRQHSTNSQDNLGFKQWQYGQSKSIKRKEEGVIPSDEREDDEESVQYKLLNNSNFIPSMHSRYANDDSQ